MLLFLYHSKDEVSSQSSGNFLKWILKKKKLIKFEIKSKKVQVRLEYENKNV